MFSFSGSLNINGTEYQITKTSKWIISRTMSNEMLVIHGLSEIVAPVGPLLRWLDGADEIILQWGVIIVSVNWRKILFFRVNITSGTNKIMEQAASHDDQVLLFNWVIRMTPKDGPPRLQNAEGTFNNITSLGMFKIEIFLVILGSHRTRSKFLQMVPDTSIRCQKTISICVPTINQVVLA